MKLAVVVVASCLAAQVSCFGLRAAGGSKVNFHNTKGGALQGSNRTLELPPGCETTKVYSQVSGQYAWGGKHTNAAECVAACQAKDSAYTHYNFYPQCKLAGKDKNGKCACMCSKSATAWNDRSEYVAQGYGYVSGPLNCDRCTWTCQGANCASCEKVDRMESTYYGNTDGQGSISWSFPDSTWHAGIYSLKPGKYSGYCFKPQQNNKDIDIAFITADGDERGQQSLSAYTYTAGNKICYVTKTYGVGAHCQTLLYIDGVQANEGVFDYITSGASERAGSLPVSFQMKFVGGDAAVSDVEFHHYPYQSAANGGTLCCDDSTKGL